MEAGGALTAPYLQCYYRKEQQTMFSMTYLAVLEPGEDGSYGISFPDLPGCFSYGENLAHAGQMAAEAGEDFFAVFFTQLFHNIQKPLSCLGECFSLYFSAFMNTLKWYLFVCSIFGIIGLLKAFPKHEFQDIENGSSDWSENGEQYAVLSKKKGIILAEKNYLPVDKRGNVNVLVVRRFWCW